MSASETKSLSENLGLRSWLARPRALLSWNAQNREGERLREPGFRTGTPCSIGEIFFAFFRLGFSAFGGPAMIQNIQRLVVEKKGWVQPETFRKGTAFCQMIPGATAMQTAAFAGLKVRGVPGAAAAFIGFGLPAFLIMCLLSYLYGTIGFPVFLFTGMRLAVIVITFHAACVLGKAGIKKWHNAALIVLGLSLFLCHIHPIGTILLATVGGLLMNKPARAPAESDPNGNPDANAPGRVLFVLLVAATVSLLILRCYQVKLFSLCLTMARIDLLAFGGGFASVPLMLHEVVEHQALMPQHEFISGIALGQITPGPLIITATFVGYYVQGWAGAVCATVFVFLPSFLLVCGLSGPYERFSRWPPVNVALDSIFLAFVGLIAGAGTRMILQNPLGLKESVACMLLFLLLLARVPSIFVVLLGIEVSWFFLLC